MSMIGHYHYCIEAEFSAVRRKTCVDDDLTHRPRKSAVIVRRESYEKGLEIRLIVCGGVHICAAYQNQ
jgi:hypothetical protein